MLAAASSTILNRFFDLLKQSTSRVLILDYDGTLAPFTPKRMEAMPYPGVAERLEAIITSTNTHLVVMSGRSLSDLKQLITLPPSVELWGCHGMERQTPKTGYKKATLEKDVEEGLAQGKKQCEELLSPLQYEVKPTSIAAHWRGGKRKLIEQQLLPLWKKISAGASLEVHPFDGGIELRPRSHNKGTAVQKLLSELPAGAAIAYLGDDRTDEEAFAVLGDRGLKVLVRTEPRDTLADIRITPPEELLQFLDNWIQHTQG